MSNSRRNKAIALGLTFAAASTGSVVTRVVSSGPEQRTAVSSQAPEALRPNIQWPAERLGETASKNSIAVVPVQELVTPSIEISQPPQATTHNTEPTRIPPHAKSKNDVEPLPLPATETTPQQINDAVAAKMASINKPGGSASMPVGHDTFMVIKKKNSNLTFMCPSNAYISTSNVTQSSVSLENNIPVVFIQRNIESSEIQAVALNPKDPNSEYEIVKLSPPSFITSETITKSNTDGLIVARDPASTDPNQPYHDITCAPVTLTDATPNS